MDMWVTLNNEHLGSIFFKELVLDTLFTRKDCSSYREVEEHVLLRNIQG